MVISFQIHRFKSVNDQHGYEAGEWLLKSIADALRTELGKNVVIARLSGDEFAAALALAASEMNRAEELADTVLRIVSTAADPQ